jgi:hypothetical protein
MKKWHMEGILDKANNLQRKVVLGQGDQIFLRSDPYSSEIRRKSMLLGCFRFFSFLGARKS